MTFYITSLSLVHPLPPNPYPYHPLSVPGPSHNPDPSAVNTHKGWIGQSAPVSHGFQKSMHPYIPHGRASWSLASRLLSRNHFPSHSHSLLSSCPTCLHFLNRLSLAYVLTFHVVGSLGIQGLSLDEPNLLESVMVYIVKLASLPVI